MLFFIAEVSSNHAQDLARCFDFIDKAAEVGCDAVKFQLFKINELFTQKVLTQSKQHRDRKNWELPLAFIPKLVQRCHQKNIQFCCTPFYLAAVTELMPYTAFYKIGSYELLWDDLLIACAKTKKPVILSTGMATLDEVKHAVQVLQDNGCANLTLLHCTSAYPTPIIDANLSVIHTLRKETGCKIGWSDHTVQPAVIYRAVHGFGAEVIEFHFDLEGLGAEFSAGHCWLPEKIATVIKNIREGFQADGRAEKWPTASEQAERFWRADPHDGLRPLQSLRQNLVL